MTLFFCVRKRKQVTPVAPAKRRYDDYTECDVNYEGGYRGAERIIFSDDGDIYYTGDHYESFEQLY